jgi:hypothetical protein
VIESVATCAAAAFCAAVPTLLGTAETSTIGLVNRPSFCLSVRMRVTDWSMRAWLICPECTASSTALIASPRLSGMSRTSSPALIASTARWAGAMFCSAAADSASVMTTPL